MLDFYEIGCEEYYGEYFEEYYFEEEEEGGE